MMETLYVPGAPVWTGFPPAGFSWVQTGPQILADGIGSGRSGPAMPPPSTSFNPFGYTPMSPFGGAPGFAGNDFTAAIPATVLLATVAMRRGQPHGPTSDAEVEEFLYDALELLTGASDVEVRNDGGRATLTGTVPHKRLKRDIGEIAWAMPGVTDVQNNLAIAARRRSRNVNRESEAHPSSPNASARKPA